MEFTQDFYTSRRNYPDGDTYLGQKGRLWYDSNTNTIRIGDGTPGGTIVSSSTGGGVETDPIFVSSPAFGITDADIINWNAGGAESDPIFTASPAFGITAGDITNWDAAETDPVFTASDAFGITAADITNWDAPETDPVFTASAAFGITAGDITNWDAPETDPVFLASPAFGISAGDITNWDAPETDPVFTASDAFSISTADITNWDTAFGWGDHSVAGYATTADINLEGGTANQVLVKQSGTDNDYVWEDLITYEPVYTKLIDDVSVVGTTYLGEALPDSLEAQAVWRIKEIIFDATGNVDSVRYAGGDFDQLWTARLGLTYV